MKKINKSTVLASFMLTITFLQLFAALSYVVGYVNSIISIIISISIVGPISIGLYLITSDKDYKPSGTY